MWQQTRYKRLKNCLISNIQQQSTSSGQNIALIKGRVALLETESFMIIQVNNICALRSTFIYYSISIQVLFLTKKVCESKAIATKIIYSKIIVMAFQEIELYQQISKTAEKQ